MKVQPSRRSQETSTDGLSAPEPEDFVVPEPDDFNVPEPDDFNDPEPDGEPSDQQQEEAVRFKQPEIEVEEPEVAPSSRSKLQEKPQSDDENDPNCVSKLVASLGNQLEV